MLLIFPLIYVVAFVIAAREIYRGNHDGIFIFIIFGLSIYYTAMSVTFANGFGFLIPFFQFFKEIMVLCVLALNLISLRFRPRFHLIDYLIFGYLAYNILYALLPIGLQGFTERLLALKSSAFYIIVYFAGRLFDPRKVQISKLFNYVILLTIAAGAVTLIEVAAGRQLQLYTGYAEYSFSFFHLEPEGSFGLSTTFESEGGYRRFASFFTTPLEHAPATVIALAIIFALYTHDDNKIKFTGIGWLALGASLISIIFAFSRSPLIAYFLVIYIYARATHKKSLVKFFNVAGIIIGLYVAYLFTAAGSVTSGLVEVLMNTINFSNPSSVGHLLEWVEGVTAIVQHPFGLGLGASGRVGSDLGDNVGGENQFIIIGVQTGIIALILYLSAFITFIKTSFKWLPHLTGNERKLCMAVFLIKVGLIIPLLTSEVEGSSYISYLEWFLSGIFISMIMRASTVGAPQLITAND